MKGLTSEQIKGVIKQLPDPYKFECEYVKIQGLTEYDAWAKGSSSAMPSDTFEFREFSFKKVDISGFKSWVLL